MSQVIKIDVEKVISSKSTKLAKYAPKCLINWIKRLIHQDEINTFLAETPDLEGVDFANAAKKFLDVDCDVYGLENIPKDKKFIFVSNHPLGGMDGILLISTLGNYFDKKIWQSSI